MQGIDCEYSAQHLGRFLGAIQIAIEQTQLTPGFAVLWILFHGFF